MSVMAHGSHGHQMPKAMLVCTPCATPQIDDVLHVVRHDARKLARVRELLNKHAAIKEARKVMGDEDMGDALKTAADLGDDDDAGAGPGAG